MVNGVKFIIDPKSNKALSTNKSFIDTGILKLPGSLNFFGKFFSFKELLLGFGSPFVSSKQHIFLLIPLKNVFFSTILQNNFLEAIYQEKKSFLFFFNRHKRME